MNARIWFALALVCLAAGNCASAPPAPPAAIGGAAAPTFEPGLRDSLGQILRAGIRDSAFPGAVVVVGTKDSAVISVAEGRLDWQPSPATSMTTMWDMASLTKVVALT